MGSAVVDVTNHAWPWSTTGGVNTITVEVLGGGGGGGGVTNNTEGEGGGGKGGAYVRVTITKGAETTLDITVGGAGTAGTTAGGGAGGASSVVQNSVTKALAPGGNGGGGGSGNQAYAGATTENGSEVHTGGVYYAGGNGGDGNITTHYSGGGGGAAGPSAAGTAGGAPTAGARGAGTWGDNSTTRNTAGAAGVGTAESDGNGASNYGGGGSGGVARDATNHGGGAGGAGIVVLTWEDVTAKSGSETTQPRLAESGSIVATWQAKTKADEPQPVLAESGRGFVTRATAPKDEIAEALTESGGIFLTVGSKDDEYDDTYVAPTGFLSAHASGRYLVDSNGDPFLLIGDAGWSLISELTLVEATSYLTTRAAQGYNAVLTNALEAYFCVNAPNNRANDPPFTTPGNFSTPGSAYWSHVDDVLAVARSRGIICILDVMYLGYEGGEEGWWSALTNETNTQAVCTGYGQFLGNRYKTTPNIIWLLGGDYIPAADSEGETRLHKIGEGIRAAGDTHLITANWNRGTKSTDQVAMRDLVQLNGTYADSGTWATNTAWKYNGPLPVYLHEDYYVNEWSITPADARNEKWNGFLNGALAGVLNGNGIIWSFNDTTLPWDPWDTGGDWADEITGEDSLDMGRMAACLRDYAWWKLLPSNTTPMRRLIPSSNGVSGAGIAAYVSSACASDGTVLLAHAPSTGSATATQVFTVDCRSMAGNSRARWWNPSTAAYTDITAGAYTIANTESAYEFTTPGANGSGANDWLLVLDTQ